ncbi:MAG TPA: PTS ascorbate transporter subunit IIC [Oscillospiraceae bacterium]|nr:PTS ascorbate transporter subunit IIC [Oscillospiraceae bacterium]HNY00614.1 PTS ascorbate transporter subunit IIC [Oscillospiraceae bacterium]HPS76495.1 PTS ascorbate transporter subunit IIC [Oscillospiraceae bacterium]
MKGGGSATDDKSKKQVPLRISASLWNDLSKWADDDFRSINGQIEYLLTECVRQHRKNGGTAPKDL